MDINWMPEALRDLQNIQEYIGKDSTLSSREVIKSIFTYTTNQLEIFPRSGRIGRVDGTLELVVPRLPYFIPYRFKKDRIEILRVYHTSRLLPEKF